MMNKLVKRAISVVLATAMAAALLLVPAVDAQATVFGEIFSEGKTDAKGISIPSKCKLYLGTGSIINGIEVGLPQGAEITGIKSSSPKLKANVVCNGYTMPYTYTRNETFSNGKPAKKITGTDNLINTDAVIGLYTTKKGTYTLTVTITLANKEIVTKKVKIKAVDDNARYIVTYSGQTFDEKTGFIKTTKESGKLKVKNGTGTKVTKVEFANSFDVYGNPIYKTKSKSGSKVTLNQRPVIYVTEGKETGYYTNKKEGTVNYSETQKYTKPITYSYLFAYSVVRVSYKDTWTGKVYDVGDANKDGASSDGELYYIYYIK